MHVTHLDSSGGAHRGVIHCSKADVNTREEPLDSVSVLFCVGRDLPARREVVKGVIIVC